MIVRVRRRSGSAAVETALLLPFMLLLMTAIFDIGFAAWEQMQVQSAAAAGAEYAVRNSWNAGQISSIVSTATGASGISATPTPSQFCACPVAGSLTTIACNATCANGNKPGIYALITAQKSHFTVLQYPAFSQPLTLSGQVTVRLQ
jgi:Flp pilus assembly protein TadG